MVKEHFVRSEWRASVGAVRSVGIVSHVDAGKMTTPERVLFYTGVNYTIGNVHANAAAMGPNVQERERGITITSFAGFYNGIWIDIIDLPKHGDLNACLEQSLRVLAVAVVADNGKPTAAITGLLSAREHTVQRRATTRGLKVGRGLPGRNRLEFERPLTSWARDQTGCQRSTAKNGDAFGSACSPLLVPASSPEESREMKRGSVVQPKLSAPIASSQWSFAAKRTQIKEAGSAGLKVFLTRSKRRSS